MSYTQSPPSFEMRSAMAQVAKRDEIPFRIIAAVGTRRKVVNLEFGAAATPLAAPIVAPQYLLSQLLVGDGR